MYSSYYVVCSVQYIMCSVQCVVYSYSVLGVVQIYSAYCTASSLQCDETVQFSICVCIEQIAVSSVQWVVDGVVSSSSVLFAL